MALLSDASKVVSSNIGATQEALILVLLKWLVVKLALSAGRNLPVEAFFTLTL